MNDCTERAYLVSTRKSIIDPVHERHTWTSRYPPAISRSSIRLYSFENRAVKKKPENNF